jgi:hypothetical protein
MPVTTQVLTPSPDKRGQTAHTAALRTRRKYVIRRARAERTGHGHAHAHPPHTLALADPSSARQNMPSMPASAWGATNAPSTGAIARRAEQFSPSHPSKHAHTPEGKHAPDEGRNTVHSDTIKAQSRRMHAHTPEGMHAPWAEHRFGHMVAQSRRNQGAIKAQSRRNQGACTMGGA